MSTSKTIAKFIERKNAIIFFTSRLFCLCHGIQQKLLIRFLKIDFCAIRDYLNKVSAFATRVSDLSKHILFSLELCAPSLFSTKTKSQ